MGLYLLSLVDATVSSYIHVFSLLADLVHATGFILSFSM